MKQRKIAISLAVVGALAAPLVLHTYAEKYHLWRTWRPLTAEEEATHQLIIATRDQECRMMTLEGCLSFREHLKDDGYVDGGRFVRSAVYLPLNVLVAIVGFAVIFGLLLPALARRYWRWLNT
jgi:hypothetical protein